MAVNFNDAISAYKAAAQSAQTGQNVNTQADVGRPGESFAELVKGQMNDAVEAGRAGEEMSMKAIAGQADLRDVVTAVTNAEVTLQTVVSIRDKVLSAYQDIIKMPI